MSAIAFWPGLAAGEELWLWPTFRTGSQQQQQQHVALAAAAATNGASMLQFQKPQTCHAATVVCMCVCVRGENRKIIAWKLEMAPWKKRGQQTRPARTNDRQKEAGSSRHTHTHTHSCTPHVASWTSSIGKRLVGLDQSRVRRVLGSPANRIIPFVCTLMVQLRHLCCQDKVQLTQA